MTVIDRTAYGPVFGELLREERMSPLDAGAPDTLFLSALEKLGGDADFAPHDVRDKDMAGCCRAGAWLYHEYLDQCHEICQDIHTHTGSYWHAILHRREPDYDNARYWFRHVGHHPIYPALCQGAHDLAKGHPHPDGAFLMTQSLWDPFAFVDLCEACLTGRAFCTDLAREVQKLEWELLFDFCWRQAVGRA